MVRLGKKGKNNKGFNKFFFKNSKKYKTENMNIAFALRDSTPNTVMMKENAWNSYQFAKEKNLRNPGSVSDSRMKKMLAYARRMNLIVKKRFTWLNRKK